MNHNYQDNTQAKHDQETGHSQIQNQQTYNKNTDIEDQEQILIAQSQEGEENLHGQIAHGQLEISQLAQYQVPHGKKNGECQDGHGQEEVQYEEPLEELSIDSQRQDVQCQEGQEEIGMNNKLQASQFQGYNINGDLENFDDAPMFDYFVRYDDQDQGQDGVI